jgi:protein-tyrosine phosphatase
MANVQRHFSWTPVPPGTIGRVDVHSHLVPGVDDGCQTLDESLECARLLVREGYTHSFCTPHVWPSLPLNTVDNIRRMVADLRIALEHEHIPLRVFPGGEINLREDTLRTAPDALVSYDMAGRYVLVDLWAERIPPFFGPNIRWLQSRGATVVLAHPERMRAVQIDPSLADTFAELGLLLQGNLQCFADPPHAETRRMAERFLCEGRYFMLGSDLHNVRSMPVRIAGLYRVAELIGEDGLWRLTSENPRKLLPSSAVPSSPSSAAR